MAFARVLQILLLAFLFWAVSSFVHNRGLLIFLFIVAVVAILWRDWDKKRRTL